MRALRTFVIVAAVLLGAWATSAFLELARQQQTATKEQAALRDRIVHLESQSTVLSKQVESLGGQPFVVPDTAKEIVAVPGPRGPQGSDGERGDDGRDGADGVGRTGATGGVGERGADGADGADGATGPQGPAGATGPEGPAGRGIQSLECVDGTWRVTFTDGETDDAGNCAPELVDLP